MTLSTSEGVALAVVAGLMSGNCMLPSKFLRVWQWENMWAAFSLVSLIFLPWALAFALVHHLLEIYRSLPVSQFFVPIEFGVGWGIAQILFGISVDRLGVSLAYAIVVGMGAALGTLVPMVTTLGSQLNKATIFAVSVGVALMLTGIACTAIAGRLRDGMQAETVSSSKGNKYRVSILLAILCGFLAPMLNYSFAFGQPIAMRSIAFGNSPVLAAYAVWPIGLAGGFIPNAGYATYLLFRRRSWGTFARSSPDLMRSCAMGLLWMGAFAVYGMSAVFLGRLGTSIGWGLFQIFMILAASLSGLLIGEWRRAPGKAQFILWAGMSLLIAATVALTLANRS